MKAARKCQHSLLQIRIPGDEVEKLFNWVLINHKVNELTQNSESLGMPEIVKR